MKRLLLLGLATTLILTGCQPSSSQSPTPKTTKPTTKTVAATKTATLQDAPSFQAYSAESLNPLHGKKPYVLSFLADWCGKCVKFEKELEQSISSFPKGTHVLRVDFDTAQDLKKKYSITSQHHHVFIKSDGSVEMVKMGASLEEIKDFFQS